MHHRCLGVRIFIVSVRLVEAEIFEDEVSEEVSASTSLAETIMIYIPKNNLKCNFNVT